MIQPAQFVRRVLLPLLLLLSAPICAAQPRYVEVSDETGLVFEGSYGAAFELTELERLLQRNMGNGVAVADYDADGDIDVYLLSQLGLPNVLFRNDLDLGLRRFTDVTEQAGIGDTGMSRAAQFADLDGDGHVDLLLLNDDSGGGDRPASRVFRNVGDGTFSDVGDTGFAPAGFLRCGMSLADYDGDGLLDVYVTVWTSEGGSGAPVFPGENRLYRNDGDFRFTDVTDEVGLGGLSRDSFTAVFHDFDGDRDPDLFVAVDHTQDAYYRNDGGVFELATGETNLLHSGNDMGVALADLDDDDDLDIYATNITDPDGIFGTTQYNALHINGLTAESLLRFDDEAIARGAADTYWGWGVELIDIEADGDLDIVAATGFDAFLEVYRPSSALIGTPPVLLLNDGTAHFSRSLGSGLDVAADSRGLIAFDYDRDGDEDLLFTNVDGRARLYENRGASGHWFGVRLTQQSAGNLRGFGATVRATSGGVTRRREMLAGESYLSSGPAEVLFGLGDATSIDTLTVDWTDGSQSVFSDVEIDRWATLVQGIADADADGAEDALDCAPGNGHAWSVPGASTSLRLTGGAHTRLTWGDPSAPGATTTTFDLLRSGEPLFSVRVQCPTIQTVEHEAIDDAIPGSLFFYLVRSANTCGRNSGDSSAGNRATPDCP